MVETIFMCLLLLSSVLFYFYRRDHRAFFGGCQSFTRNFFRAKKLSTFYPQVRQNQIPDNTRITSLFTYVYRNRENWVVLVSPLPKPQILREAFALCTRYCANRVTNRFLKDLFKNGADGETRTLTPEGTGF